MSTTNESQIIGLKSEVSRQVGKKLDLAKELAYHKSFILQMWRNAYSSGESVDEEIVHDSIWNYARSNNLWYKGKMDKYKSCIGPYTNAKGVVSQVHYTIHFQYLGSVKSLGTEPISYNGYFEIKDSDFQIDWEILMNPNTALIEAIFKEKIEEDSDSVCVCGKHIPEDTGKCCGYCSNCCCCENIKKTGVDYDNKICKCGKYILEGSGKWIISYECNLCYKCWNEIPEEKVEEDALCCRVEEEVQSERAPVKCVIIKRKPKGNK